MAFPTSCSPLLVTAVSVVSSEGRTDHPTSVVHSYERRRFAAILYSAVPQTDAHSLGAVRVAGYVVIG